VSFQEKVVMLKATLTFVRRKQPLTRATALAQLDADDVDFLTRHVSTLREEAGAERALLSRFHHGSAVPDLLTSLLTATADDFVAVSGGLASRLQESMDQATNPSTGVLAILTTGAGDKADSVSILKLDAITEAAQYELEAGQVRLSVLRDLLPAPGQLQKGLSLPDPRAGSEAIVIDRNISAAKYFFNAYELQVSATPHEAERALSRTIFKHVPKEKRSAAIRLAASLKGPAEKVVAAVKKEYPEVKLDQSELGAGDAIGGYIRSNKVASHRTRYRADGIVVTVPWDRLDQVSGPKQVAGGWEMTIRFNEKPEEDTT
jgi:hypothetical protein